MNSEYLKSFHYYMSKKGYLNEEAKPIAYGVQFYVSDGTKKELIRIYENAKGKITLDASQIKSAELKEYVLAFANGSGTEPKGGISGKTGKTDKGAAGAVQSIYPLLAPPLIGSDEAGKGDYFGPLTAAAVYADEDAYRRLTAAGVRDSKALTDARIAELAKQIKLLCPQHGVIVIGNDKFNEFYGRAGNINAVLSWAHGKAVKTILEKTPCKNVLTDKFGSTHWMISQLKEYELNIVQEPRAEQNAAVAAASILARDAFVKAVQKLRDEYKLDFPLGASEAADICGREFVKRYGENALAAVAKVSFKNTQRIIIR